MSAVVFGDSNSSPQWITGARPWPRRLGDRLAGEVAGEALVRSCAIGGSQVHIARGRSATVPPVETHALATLARAEQDGTLPGSVIVCGATNDLPVETIPPAEWGDVALAFQTLDTTLRERWGIPMYVISCLPMRVGGMLSQQVWEQREPRRLALNASLRTMFGPTGRFLDADTVVGEGLSGSVQLWSPYVHDALHLNRCGHVALADAIPLGWVP